MGKLAQTKQQRTDKAFALCGVSNNEVAVCDCSETRKKINEKWHANKCYICYKKV